MVDRGTLVYTLLGGVFSYVLCDFHRTEVRPTHAAEMSRFSTLLRQRFVVELAGSLGIERKIELILTSSPRPANSPSRVTLNVIYPVAPSATVFPAV